MIVSEESVRSELNNTDNDLPKIGVLGSVFSFNPNLSINFFSDLDSLLSSAPFDVLIINQSGHELDASLRKLRADTRYQYTLIYCQMGQEPLSRALSDGPVPTDLDTLDRQWRLWRERLALLRPDTFFEKFEKRVIAWLWLRGDATLYAVKDSASVQYYRYPLLDVLSDGEIINQFSWLQLMRQQGWFDELTLVDRIRLCPGCSSGRLNYVDICPECHTLDIARQPSLHCFTCGHVGGQDKFLKDGLLVCPNCLSRLRHIGSDYDRPMENYRCQGCQAFFVDAEVQARCLECDKPHSPDQLVVREVRDYQLSEAARIWCRQGLSHDERLNQQFGRLSVVSKSQFIALLDWQIQLAQRHQNLFFALLGVRFVNLRQTLFALGEMRGHSLIDSLVSRLQSAVRETDRCCRFSEEVLWILLPHTDAQGLEVVRRRLSESQTRLSEKAEANIEIRLSLFTAPQGLLDQENAELLLARLAGELG